MKKLSAAAVLLVAVTLGFLVQHQSLSPPTVPSPTVGPRLQTPASPPRSSSSLRTPAETELASESSLDRARAQISAKRSSLTAARILATAPTAVGDSDRLPRNFRISREGRTVPGTPSSHLLSSQPAEERIARTYADFFAKFAVDPATQSEIIALLVERNLSVQDILALSGERGLSAKDRDQLVSAQLNQDVKALEAILGKERAQALLFYGASQSYQPYASEFTNRCAWRGVAVTPDIAELVGRITTVYRPIALPSTLSIAETRAALISIATRKVGTELTPAQLEVFKQMLTDQLNRLAQQSPPGS